MTEKKFKKRKTLGLIFKTSSSNCTNYFDKNLSFYKVHKQKHVISFNTLSLNVSPSWQHNDLWE